MILIYYLKRLIYIHKSESKQIQDWVRILT